MSTRFRVCGCVMPNPPNGKRVLRPIRFGNPFTIAAEGTAEAVVGHVRQHLADHPELVELARRELRGFDLGCSCTLGDLSHTDVWLRWKTVEAVGLVTPLCWVTRPKVS